MRMTGSATEGSSSVDSSVANTPDTDESPDVRYNLSIFTARCYAERDYATVSRPSVRLSKAL